MRRQHWFPVKCRIEYLFGTLHFPSKWCLRNERSNSTLMTRHYPVLGSAADRLKQLSHPTRPIKSTTHISQASFRAETSGGVAKCRLFCQVTLFPFAFFSPSSHPFLHLPLRLGIKFTCTLHGQCSAEKFIYLRDNSLYPRNHLKIQQPKLGGDTAGHSCAGQ